MILLVAHTKGGVGKSTLSWNVAHSLKVHGKNVKIIDLDFQQTLFFVNSIAAKRNQETIEVLQPKTGSELLEIINNYDGYIVIDAGGFDNDINRIALSNADKILVPISPSAVEVIGFMTFETILNDVNATAVNLVLNNIHPLQRDFTDIQNAVSHNGIKLLNTIVRSRKTYKDVMGLGKSVFEHTDLRAIAEIEELKNELF